MQKKWVYNYVDKKQVKYISKKYNISEIVAKIIVNRNISEDDLEVFLNPTRKDLHDPYLLPDIKVAIDRILKAKENNEKVIIYGDYDVDGITSQAVLKMFLTEQGLNVDTYMPNRLEEGYGLNIPAIDKIAQKGYNLIITVDCGISAIEEARYIKSKNIDLIVTDHHEVQDELPDALAVIDPKRKDSLYPFNQLAGVGVAFKVIQAIAKRLGLEEKSYLKYLDIVCTGTIADIVSLTDENRVIAKLGLKLVAVTRNPGLKALIESTKYKNVDSTSISFGIAPRINACGRMGFEQEALDLFLTNSYDEAMRITEKLNQYNRDRQEIEKRIFDEAIKEIEEKQLYNKNAIVLSGDNWYHGVIGIVASKITEIYYKPTILVCFEGEEGKGSGRSIPGFDLHTALCSCGKYLEKYGGHEMAVGLTVNKSNFNEFKKNFELMAENISKEDTIPTVYVDDVISAKDISLNTVKQISMLEPFGEGNSMPIFVYKNIKVHSVRTLSEGKHLKLSLKDGGNIFDAIGFSMGYMADSIRIGDKVDILTYLEINNFNNIEKVQFNLKDVKKHIGI